MKRKIFSVLFTLVLVLSFSLVTAAPAGATGEPDEVWVDENFEENGMYLMMFDPTLVFGVDAFDNIQDGINGVAADGTVHVRPSVPPDGDGVYRENVLIDKPLILQGEDKDTTIIDGAGLIGIPTYGNNGIVISLGAAGPANVTISGFTVQNFEVIGAADGAGITGDTTWQYTAVTISDVIVKDNGIVGIDAFNFKSSQFSNIVVDNNDTIGNGQGCGIVVNNNNSAGLNTFTNIVATNHDSSGIMVMQSNDNTFTGIDSNHNGTGIYFMLGSSGNTITGSTICDNTNNGVKLNAYGTACANNSVASSNIKGNGCGVYAVDIGAQTTFDATNNWWGNGTGPSGVGTGTGDSVSINVLYEPWLTELLGESGGPVGVNALMPQIVSISVTPTSIDFGILRPGQDSAVTDITISNTGTVPAFVDTEITEVGTFFEDNLWLDETIAVDYSTSLAVGGAPATPGARVRVPEGFAAVGEATGTLIFWAGTPD